MGAPLFALRLIAHEVAGLIGRVEMVRPFSLHETMVPGAMPSGRALREIDAYLARGRAELLRMARSFLAWLRSGRAERTHLEVVQRRFVFLRLRVNAALTQFDLFADAISQRSETDTGVWLAGLDALARDALTVPGAPYRVPELLCYLDRGLGAAIRRARTRLPGGGVNPVAVVRVPRERMVGLGIASSLVHEAGHQGAALVGLVPALRRAMEPTLRSKSANQGLGPSPWTYWHRWMAEIAADLWSVARLGISSTLGLMNVVSLPRVFVFRANLDDPHPTPWIRVLLSAELGRQLYPHPYWQRLLGVWRAAYPPDFEGMHAARLALLAEHVPTFVRRILEVPMPGVPARSLAQFLVDRELSPQRLEEHVERWCRAPQYLERLRPCRAFAVVGYCRLARGRSPAGEIPLFSSLLTRWALAA